MRVFGTLKDMVVELDRQDTWCMDHTLAQIIVPMLKQLKKNKQGIPDECWADHQDVFTFEYYDEPDDGPLHKKAKASEEAATKRWDEILEKMIWSFSQVNEDWVDQYHLGGDRFDREGYTAHSARIQEGIDLFAKHFFDLWD